MKCILVLSFAALCYALEPLPQTAPAISFGEDGKITITGADGKKVIISNSIDNVGRKNVEISVPDSLGGTRSIKINHDYNGKTINIDDPITGSQTFEGVRYKRSPVAKSSKESKPVKTEAEILDEIFKEYQAAADLKSYEKVLKEIDSYIKTGELDSTIFKVLKDFAQYDAISTAGQSPVAPQPGTGDYSRLTYLQNYLNKANGEQQGLNAPWYGPKETVSGMYQGPTYSGVSPLWYKGGDAANLPEYRDFYGQQPMNSLSPVQQKWQPSYEPYQKQMSQPLQQFAQPQQQWTLPQSIWSLPKQQLAQEQQKTMWNQMQELPWNQAQKPQQYYGSQQQYYVPQQQYYGPQQQYYGSKQLFYGPQQPNMGMQGYQPGKPLENSVNPQSKQLWTLPEQQLAQKQLGGQQIQSSVPLGSYWQRLWAPKMQYPVNVPAV